MGGGVGLEHRGNVVLGMAGGEQHAGHGEHVRDPLRPQAVEAVADDRLGEFEIAVFDRILRQARSSDAARARRTPSPPPHCGCHGRKASRRVFPASRYLPNFAAPARKTGWKAAPSWPRLGQPHRNVSQPPFERQAPIAKVFNFCGACLGKHCSFRLGWGPPVDKVKCGA